MKAVLLSIRPNWCKLIWSWMKTLEVRRTRPKLETPFKVYIYCTCNVVWLMKLPNGLQKMHGKVIGEFICDKIERVNIPYPAYQDMLDERFTKDSCVPYAELHRYASQNALRDDLFFWHISNFKLYDKPRELLTFTGFRETRFGMRPVEITSPPQSWRYVEELQNG